MPLKAAASKLDPKSQSPHMPALPCASKMQGTPGEFVGRAAPLFIHQKPLKSLTNHKCFSMEKCVQVEIEV